MNFARVITEIAGFLHRENVRFALAGAFALHAYGLSRATSDVDFVTEASVRQRLVRFLESLGYETLYSSPGYSNHLHPETEIRFLLQLEGVDEDEIREYFEKAGLRERFDEIKRSI